MPVPILGDLLKGGIEGILGSVAGIIGKFKADPNIAAQSAATIAAAEAQLNQARLDFEAKLALAQIEVNKVEAASGSWFTSNWRPAAGWVCVAGFFYQTIGAPCLIWLSKLRGWPEPPILNSDTLNFVLFGMLGLGTWRTVDKIKGVTRDSPGRPDAP